MESEGELETIDPFKGGRTALLGISCGKCFIKTLGVDMSRKHRITMALDIFYIAFIPAMTVLGCLKYASNLMEIAISSSIGLVVFVSALGKILCDFNNWVYTINQMQKQIGVLCAEDLKNLCEGLIESKEKETKEEGIVKEETPKHVEEVNDKNHTTDSKETIW